MKYFLTLLVLASFQAQSATMAILDSGLDVAHTAFPNNIWTNPGEINGDRRDNDGNFFRDDFFGWNFASDNNQVINPKYLGTFSNDPKRVIGMQSDLLLNGFSSSAMGCYCQSPRQGRCTEIDYDAIYKGTSVKEDDFAWLCSKRGDPEFGAELGRFGNFAHGTHVASIASRMSPRTLVMGLKLIPTERSEVLGLNQFSKESTFTKPLEGSREKILTTLIEKLASAQVGSLANAFNYIKGHSVDVVNGSFGTPFNAIKQFTDIAYRIVFFKKPTKEQSDKWAGVFFNKHIEGVTSIISQNPKTVFVFAAGNDGTNNDVFPSTPTNVSLPNVISVAASLDRVALAGFSNYGAREVDLAAPGVGIKGAIPTPTHSEFLRFSGTSQASPFVAGVVSMMLEIFPKMTPAEIKEALISTVDKKSFLNGIVFSGGIINEVRAVKVAELMSRGIGFRESIAAVNQRVSDIKAKLSKPKAYTNMSVDLMPDFSDTPKVRKLMQDILGNARASLNR